MTVIFSQTLQRIFTRYKGYLRSNAKTLLKRSLSAVGRSIANFFGFGGGDEEESTAPEPVKEQPVKLEAPKETIPEELGDGMTVAELDEKIRRAEVAQRLHDNKLK